ncbi:MAG: hypothetical protein ACLUOI_29300 [Eisenbergiella sp.]
MKVYGLEGYEDYKVPRYTPAPVQPCRTTMMFLPISQRGHPAHHPYMSFEPVVDFVRQAAKDPQVLAIKQTRIVSAVILRLLRLQTGGGERQAGIAGGTEGKIDENNIVWAKMLEKAGCHVIYGLLRLKPARLRWWCREETGSQVCPSGHRAIMIPRRSSIRTAAC